MEHEEFTKALLIAFNDNAIKRSLVEIVAQAVSGPVAQRVTESLKNEIVLLRKDLRARDQTIAKMQETIDNLSAETDRLEQLVHTSQLRESCWHSRGDWRRRYCQSTAPSEPRYELGSPASAERDRSHPPCGQTHKWSWCSSP